MNNSTNTSSSNNQSASLCMAGSVRPEAAGTVKPERGSIVPHHLRWC